MNQTLLEMANTAKKRMMRYLQRAAAESRRLKDSNDQHQLMMDHIARGDSPGTADAFMALGLYGKQRLFGRLEAQPHQEACLAAS